MVLLLFINYTTQYPERILIYENESIGNAITNTIVVKKSQYCALVSAYQWFWAHFLITRSKWNYLPFLLLLQLLRCWSALYMCWFLLWLNNIIFSANFVILNRSTAIGFFVFFFNWSKCIGLSRLFPSTSHSTIILQSILDITTSRLHCLCIWIY